VVSALYISAAVTAYQRVNQTLVTLRKLQDCQPPPSEILVHVDGNQVGCAVVIRATFPGVRVLASEDNLGPGGGRNKLVAAAAYKWVASFDDDSCPHDRDFFARAGRAIQEFPGVAVFAANIYQRGEPVPDETSPDVQEADFGGGGCVFSRAAFLEAGGYVPLPMAYGMEEVDLALRLHAIGKRALRVSKLRVFHDTEMQRHAASDITAGSIANLALLTFLRYPVCLWPLGFGQILNRARWLVLHQRFAGIPSGLRQIPTHCWRHRQFRKPVPATVIQSYLALRRKPQMASSPRRTSND
jgi:GT2 family glycosyltransferase